MRQTPSNTSEVIQTRRYTWYCLHTFLMGSHINERTQNVPLRTFFKKDGDRNLRKMIASFFWSPSDIQFAGITYDINGTYIYDALSREEQSGTVASNARCYNALAEWNVNVLRLSSGFCFGPTGGAQSVPVSLYQVQEVGAILHQTRFLQKIELLGSRDQKVDNALLDAVDKSLYVHNLEITLSNSADEKLILQLLQTEKAKSIDFYHWGHFAGKYCFLLSSLSEEDCCSHWTISLKRFIQERSDNYTDILHEQKKFLINLQQINQNQKQQIDIKIENSHLFFYTAKAAPNLSKALQMNAENFQYLERIPLFFFIHSILSLEDYAFRSKWYREQKTEGFYYLLKQQIPDVDSIRINNIPQYFLLIHAAIQNYWLLNPTKKNHQPIKIRSYTLFEDSGAKRVRKLEALLKDAGFSSNPAVLAAG